MPTYQAKYIYGAHKACTQKLSLQKSLSYANASRTHSASFETIFSLTFYDEGRTHNTELAAMVTDLVTMSCISLSAINKLDVILFSFLLLTSTLIRNAYRKKTDITN